ncbi:PilZ domain-containing protein [Sphingomonas sp. XXL09]|uniref:PilZ domain-containing protein n=1 Tax=Sphingomonas sp. XXL09 TaxID=3457787 RepID=UPI00406BC54D
MIKQREPRRKVLVRARMRSGTEWHDVIIHNMSSRGLLATSKVPCKTGTVIELRRVHHVIVGRVVWEKDQYFGVRTQDRLDVDAIVDAKPPAFKPGSEPTRDDERRSAPRRITAASIAEREARSRRFSSVFQFAILGAAACLGAALVAERVGHVLSSPFATISEHLAAS